MQPFSPIDKKKQICEGRVSSLSNKDNRTIKVNEGQKMSEVVLPEIISYLGIVE